MSDTDDTLLADVAAYIEGARWFGGKGRDFTVAGLRRVGTVPGASAGLTAVIELVEIVYADGDREHYQLPLALYPARQERIEHAFVTMVDDPDLGEVHAYDALHDREAMALWLAAFARAGEEAVTSADLTFHRLPGHDLDLDTHSTLFTGEQSNSSVAFGEDSLMKVFRKVTPGVNPDISIHEVLTRAESEHVAALYGWLEMVDEETDSTIQLAMLQQFLRTATDGWELALASVRNLYAEADLHAEEVGGDFAGESARLGVALAETHAALAEHFPTERRDAAAVTDLAAAMGARLDDALAVVPALAEHEDALRATYAQLAGLDSIDVQQVHGDLHLGQTLRTAKGWKIVDFEGEPAKPLAERLLPDSPWRDVAGMLRSFDYAPQVVSRTGFVADFAPGDGHQQQAYRATEWSARNGEAFLSAYADRELTARERVLLDAYVADKAVYETVYETRNRPVWVEIPLGAIDRLTHSRPGSARTEV